jgi:hypothetical protein
MSSRQKPKRKRAKFTNSAKVTLAALSVMGFIGGWDLIARLDRIKEAEASSSNTVTLPPTSPPAAELIIRPTPWPTITPLPELSAIPTLVPTRTSAGQTASTRPSSQGDTLTVRQDKAPAQIAPVPTLDPLPTLAPLPTMPPPPPPPPAPTWNGGNGNFSGGS